MQPDESEDEDILLDDEFDDEFDINEDDYRFILEDEY